MKKLVLIFILGMAVNQTIGKSSELGIPNNLNLPQVCRYLPPHEDFGTISISKNDQTSINVTGLKGVDGPVVMSYKGSFADNGQIIFMKDDSGLPPEVKLLPDGGDTVFYGDTWGYDVHCDVM